MVWSEDLKTEDETRGVARREQEAGTMRGDNLDNDEGPDDEL